MIHKLMLELVNMFYLCFLLKKKRCRAAFGFGRNAAGLRTGSRRSTGFEFIKQCHDIFRCQIFVKMLANLRHRCIDAGTQTFSFPKCKLSVTRGFAYGNA